MHRGRGVTQDALERSGALVAAELEKIKTMPVEEFAARMADLWSPHHCTASYQEESVRLLKKGLVELFPC